MKLRWLIIVGLGILMSARPSARAAEPYLEFVEGLRRHNYHDYAMIYLDKLEKRADVPKEIKEVIPFEKALTLMDEARRGTQNATEQNRLYDQARSFLEEFVKASPNHPEAGKANTELANVIVGKGKVEVMQSKAPGNSGQKADFQKKARAHFAEARKVFQAAHDRYKEAYEKFDKFIDKTQKGKYEAREEAYRNYIQAQLNLAVLTYEEAQTYDKGSSENRKLLTDAAKTFSDIHARYRQQIAGLYARMWEGKCFEEQDDIVKALGIYNELLGHGGDKPSEALKRLQDNVRHFRLVCLNREQRKDYQVVIQEAQEWLKQNRGSAANTRVGLGIQWELVRALELLAKKEETAEPEKNRLFNQALGIARTVARYPSEYRDGANAMIGRLQVELNRDPGDPKDFPQAFAAARNLVIEIPKKKDAIEKAAGSERAKLLSDLQPILKESARLLGIGLALVNPKDDPKDINQARHFLAYVYFTMRDGTVDRSYDAAVLGEYVARKAMKTQPDLALEAAYLAQAAYIQAYHHPPDDPRVAEAKQAADFRRIISICNFITENWSTNEMANDARMALGRVYSEIGQPAKAAEIYDQVPETSAKYLDAQLEAGNAFWYAYLSESIKPEAERKPKEELDGMLKKSQEILQKGIGKYEAPLPGEASQVEESKLAYLTRAKLNYSQILNGSGDYKGALTVLKEGKLPVAAAVAVPAGEPRPKVGIKSRQYAGVVYQVILRTYVGLQDLEKAREAMHELEQIVGTSGGGASLTKIYVDLGKELQKEVERLQTARDPRLGEVLKSFESFLSDLSGRTEGQDYSSLTWVGETYRALGEGLQQGDSAKAEGYFAKAADALEKLLDENEKKPETIPSGAVLGVKLKLVKCKRLQKDFDEAHKLIVSILSEKARALDVQEEAARLFQDWAARGGPEDLNKWEIAIEGGAKSKSKEDKRVWGWFGLSEKLKSSLLNNPNPEYEQKYLDAGYNVADCWVKYAGAQSTNVARKKLLGEAYKAVERPAMLIPSLGGGETWARYNLLYRKIQQEMLDLGMEQMRGKEVTDLERRSLSREEREKAEAKTREMLGNDEFAAADDGAAAKAKKKKKKKTAAAAPVKKTASSTGWIAAVVVLVVLAGGGGAYFFLGSGKKKKRRPGSVASEPDFDLSEPKPPAAKVKR
jgi:hypothetical protein